MRGGGGGGFDNVMWGRFDFDYGGNIDYVICERPLNAEKTASTQIILDAMREMTLQVFQLLRHMINCRFTTY